jgi:hypothetical protein
LAGLGQTSSAALGSSGNNAAQTQLTGQTNIGGANAASTIGATNSLTGGISGAIGALGNPNNNPSQSAFGPSSAFGQGANYLSSLFSSSAPGATSFPVDQP